VLDPCCGSGTIFQAARETLTTATGIECDERAYGLALTKLQGAAVGEVLAAE
jgi:tRNA1(Val) A37 N6-methylase TrmN6